MKRLSDIILIWFLILFVACKQDSPNDVINIMQFLTDSLSVKSDSIFDVSTNIRSANFNDKSYIFIFNEKNSKFFIIDTKTYKQKTLHYPDTLPKFWDFYVKNFDSIYLFVPPKKILLIDTNWCTPKEFIINIDSSEFFGKNFELYASNYRHFDIINNNILIIGHYPMYILDKSTEKDYFSSKLDIIYVKKLCSYFLKNKKDTCPFYFCF